MRRIGASARWAIAAITLVGSAMVPHRAFPAPQPHGAVDDTASAHASQREALHARFRRNERRLDSLANVAAARAGDSVYVRLWREARTRRDHTQYAISLLGGSADTADPQAWEVRRSEALKELDSLEGALRRLETPALVPAPQADSGGG